MKQTGTYSIPFTKKMVPCNGTNDCFFGFETISNPEAGALTGGYKSLMEATTFIIFAIGVVLNTGILSVMISLYPNLDMFDALLMNLAFGELMASFGLSFLFFVELTSSIAPIGDHGCKFIAWLDLTSVTVTLVTLVALFSEMHKIVYRPRSSTKIKTPQFWGWILMLWIVASAPGLPYMATARMSSDGFCHIRSWSENAEILFIASMIVLQIVVPLALIVFYFVRTLIALREETVRSGQISSVLREDDDSTVNSPGSEATYQRGILRRKFTMISYQAATSFLLLSVASIIELSLALNVSNIHSNWIKHARIRELASLLLCLKTVFTPLMFIFYDKLKNKCKKTLCCFGAGRHDADVYGSLRYDVYQQTVSSEEAGNAATGGVMYNPHQREEDDEELAMANEQFAETDRDDVAILG